jgi:hypothetical protein
MFGTNSMVGSEYPCIQIPKDNVNHRQVLICLKNKFIVVIKLPGRNIFDIMATKRYYS